jgi:hypothetical protein
MTITLSATRAVDSVLENLSRRIWNLSASLPRARLHALLENLGIIIPMVWEDYFGAAIRC